MLMFEDRNTKGQTMKTSNVKMIILKDHSEWLENRKKGIGGSEISACVGLNPYLNNTELWELKTGRRQAEDISEKPYVKYGTQAEQYLRDLFKLDFPQYQVGYIENNSFTNEKYPWAQASLDGWITDDAGRKGILEIKTTEILSKASREKWNNQVPSNYYCQVLFYMAVCECDFAVIKAQLKTIIDGVPYLQTKHYHIERAEVQEDIDYLMQEGEKFWRYVGTGTRPPLILPNF